MPGLLQHNSHVLKSETAVLAHGCTYHALSVYCFVILMCMLVCVRACVVRVCVGVCVFVCVCV